MKNKNKKSNKEIKFDSEMIKNIIIGILSVVLIVVVALYLIKGSTITLFSKDEYINYEEFRAKIKDELTYEYITKPEEERKKEEEEQKKEMEMEQQKELQNMRMTVNNNQT